MDKTSISNIAGSSSAVNSSNRALVKRPGFGSTGSPIQLEANHFKVSVKSPDETFYQYNVSISYEDKNPVENKTIGRRILAKLYQTYSSELAGKKFAYDGEKALYTVGPLPRNKQEFTVVVEESVATRGSSSQEDEPGKRSRRSLYSKSYIVKISYATQIPLKSLALALKGDETDKVQDALRVLDVILRQQAANRGCLLVRQSFFQDDWKMFADVGGGVTACRGLHTSFRPTHGGLSLNIDVSTTMILTPGPVINFLLANQSARDDRAIDWVKARRMLKNMRVKATHTNREFKIIGLSEKPCSQQYFTFKERCGHGTGGQVQPVEISVYDYFVKYRKLRLESSAYFPCLDVGKSKRPNYLPLELCHLVPLQRYKKALSSSQRASLVEKSRQKPVERKKVITDARFKNDIFIESVPKLCNDEDLLLSACGISIDEHLTRFDGRVLEAPMLKVGDNKDCIPRNGRWNFNHRKLLEPVEIENWVVVNFSARCSPYQLSQQLIKCGRDKGIVIREPRHIIEEEQQYRRDSALERVEKMWKKVPQDKPPKFLMCVLPDRKNCDIYGPWKKKCLIDFGICTQCVSPIRINDQYLTNVLLKINTKLGGINSLLAAEHVSRVPRIRDVPTMILGLDVSHGSPGRSDIPSIAAVVGSHSWPHISRYRAAFRTQSSRVEMIDSLYKPLPNGEDDGMMKELLLEFAYKTEGHMPSQIIVFRDGVSESQFNQVINTELDQMIKACEIYCRGKIPKFTVIVGQKNHHTKLFRASGANENVPPGTVVDTKIVHPRNFDFYMCAQAGMIGTSRPAHYHVLVDEIGFSANDLQNFIHSLSCVYQKSTSAISIVAPIYYAHLVAAQVVQFTKFDEFGDNSSGHGSFTSSGSVPVPQLPRLNAKVAGSMFFC